MTATRKALLAGAAVAFALGLGACGEREQVIVYKQGKYQGKPDTKPWDNDPSASLYTSSTWTKGDERSWESAVKLRNQYQNEYTRAK
jgi:ABC-type glycerol-3-phosphate transport system substrate-binding protein